MKNEERGLSFLARDVRAVELPAREVQDLYNSETTSALLASDLTQHPLLFAHGCRCGCVKPSRRL